MSGISVLLNDTKSVLINATKRHFFDYCYLRPESFRSNVVVDWLTFLLRIRKIPG
jgi:hypothetical protein